MAKSLLRFLISKVVVNDNYDIVNAEDATALLAIDSIKPGLPKVLTVHGELARELKTHGYVKRKFEYELFLKLEKRAYETASLIVAVDTRLKEHIQGLIPGNEKKVKVVYNFIDVISLKQELDALDVGGIKKQFGIPLESRVMLVPRRLAKKCGVIYAVKSAEILIKIPKATDVIFLVVGNGPEHKNISGYIAVNNLRDKVVLEGEVSYRDMPKYYKIADAVIIPSINVEGYKEATSLSALEAMAAKVPVVASDIGGLSEIIKDHETGFLVPEKSPEAIADAVKTILERADLKEKITTNAFKYVMDNHHYENAAKIFAGIYKEGMRAG